MADPTKKSNRRLKQRERRAERTAHSKLVFRKKIVRAIKRDAPTSFFIKRKIDELTAMGLRKMYKSS